MACPTVALCAGPGRLTQALGITAADDGAAVAAPPFELRPPEAEVEVVATTRVGITPRGRAAVALPRQGLWLGVSRPTINATLSPLPAATPGSGLCSRTEPAGPLS